MIALPVTLYSSVFWYLDFVTCCYIRPSGLMSHNGSNLSPIITASWFSTVHEDHHEFRFLMRPWLLASTVISSVLSSSVKWTVSKAVKAKRKRTYVLWCRCVVSVMTWRPLTVLRHRHLCVHCAEYAMDVVIGWRCIETNSLYNIEPLPRAVLGTDIFSRDEATLYAGVSVRWSVTSSFFGLLGATNVVYTALFVTHTSYHLYLMHLFFQMQMMPGVI